MSINLFPAICLAGPPNSGKSVLSFLLTWHLREMGIDHYLLRAAPDGEGDWYILGDKGIVRALRAQYKGHYGNEFVEHMRLVIEKRALPLLVDIGGSPRGNQFKILQACTHSVLLYKEDHQLVEWRNQLANLDLLPIAELRSVLTGEDQLCPSHPILNADISHLDREKWAIGISFDALLDRIAGICAYDPKALKLEHHRLAPYPTIDEQDLGEQINVPQQGERLVWSPAHLSMVSERISTDSEVALYGRGPVWLATMLAIHTLPANFAIYDIRYGWINLPSILSGQSEEIAVQLISCLELRADCLKINLPDTFIEPQKICLPLDIWTQITAMNQERGLVLSGKLPRWFFAALGRHLFPYVRWMGVDDPAKNRIVVVASRTETTQKVGLELPRLGCFSST